MLASSAKDAPLPFPMLASPKLDGIRAWCPEDTILSRRMKLFPNKGIYANYEGLDVHGLDGEFCVGSITANELMRKTNSAVMSFDGDITDMVWYVFDDMTDPTMPAVDRLARAKERVESFGRDDIKFVPQVLVHSKEELAKVVAGWLEEGYEGGMVRLPSSPYKFGRSTEREAYLLKIKLFEDSEAIIIATIELDHNLNEATISETGHTKRSTKKEGKVAAGVLGAIVVRDMYTDVEFNIGTGFNAEDRRRLWEIRHELLGSVVKYSYFPTGSKEKPRFPVYLGFRNVDIDG